MPDGRRRTCKVCGRHMDEVGPISWRGYCGEHGVEINRAANHDMHYHTGHYFERWRVSMAASVGAVFPNDETR